MLSFLLSAIVLTGPVLVERVVDGDTIKVERYGMLRLVGVDTPETKHPFKRVQRCGPEAALFTSTWLLGHKVTLEFDRQPSRDKYGRLLAYVRPVAWGRSKRTFNRLLIEHGFSPAYTRFKFSRATEFLEAETMARKELRGLWSEDDCK